MKKQIYLILSLIAFNLALTGCTTMGVEKDEFKKVQKVALVGFQLDQQNPKALEINLGSKEANTALGMGMALAEDKAHAAQIYNSLNEKLKKDLKFEVVELKDLQNNPQYQAAYAQRMNGWRNIPLSQADLSKYKVEKIMDYWAISLMKPAERDQLMDELKVDHLAIARFNTILESPYSLKNIVGGQDLYPKTTVVFYMYKKGRQDAIWYDFAAAAPRHGKSVSSFLGIQDSEKLSPLIVNNSKEAMDVLFNRLNSKIQ